MFCRVHVTNRAAAFLPVASVWLAKNRLVTAVLSDSRDSNPRATTSQGGRGEQKGMGPQTRPSEYHVVAEKSTCVNLQHTWRGVKINFAR